MQPLGDIEERLVLLEQTVKAYREFLTHIVGLLLEKKVLRQEELHDTWAAIMAGIKAEEEGGAREAKRP